MFLLRCKFKNRIFFLLGSLFLFIFLWTFTTLLVIFLVQQTQNVVVKSSPDSERLGRGVQIVVGHFNGKIPEKKLSNLTFEEINENRFSPIPGLGDFGKPVKLSAAEEIRAKELTSINQFNILVSDKISLNRSLPDARKRQCRELTYPSNSKLPDTSIIIVFHNEAYSTLLRTVISVINRSPKELIKEIILVDDASQRLFLREPLELALKKLRVKTVLIRAKNRVGLIRARLMGAKEAKGKVLTFLDSHCEVTLGWLEPLLSRISENPTVAICPVIDVINDQNFAYQKGIDIFRGGFSWSLQFRWYSIPPDEMEYLRKNGTLPIPSPTMAGGLFSISRDFFYKIGSYDDKMDIWGGENLEISFRIWQCGGRVEISPCSHVGHIFRKASPHDFPDNSTGAILNTNLARVAEVWMDEWKNLFYKMTPQAYDISQKTDVSARITLRKRLKCQNFEWYLRNVWRDHFLPLKTDFFGRIATPDDEKCLTSTPGEAGKRRHSLEMKKCTLGFDLWQFWIMNENGYIKSDEHQCLGASQVFGIWLVELRECAEVRTELWSFDSKFGQMLHVESRLCLDKRSDRKEEKSKLPTLRKCDITGNTQTWSLKRVNWRTPKAFL